MEQDFYRKLYEDSPLETAVVEEISRALGVDPKTGRQVQVPNYSCRITTQTGRRFNNVPWVSPYVKPGTGAGVYVVPKAGTKVLIAYAKKGQPYIVGWLVPVAVDGAYTGGRRTVPEGSVVMRADFGNEILVLDGGVIQVVSTPTCRRSYIPVQDQIRDFCRNYFLTTTGGTLAWTESRDGQRLTTLVIEAFAKAGGKKGGAKSVRLQAGTHREEIDPEPDTPAGKIFSMIVGEHTKIFIGPNGRIIIRNEHPDGEDGNDISIDNNGRFKLKNVKQIEVSSTDGKISFMAGSGGNTQIEMDPDGDILIRSATVVKIEAQTEVQVRAQGQIELDAPFVRTTELTELGGPGGLPVTRLLDDVLVFDPISGPLSGFIITSGEKTTSL